MTAPTATAAASKAPKAQKGPKKARASVPENETPEQRFKRLGSARINKALKMLTNLETVFRSAAYSYNAEQANKAVAHLTAKVDAIRDAAVAKLNRKDPEVVTL